MSAPALLVLAGLLPAMAQAAPADTLALARQVNAQIVHRHVQEEIQAITEAMNGGAGQSLVKDSPAGCQAQMGEAVTTLYAAMAEQVRSGIEEPAYLAAMDKQLAAVYSGEELKAFLVQSADADTDAFGLYREVMSGPGLQEIDDAQKQKVFAAMDESAPSTPALAAAFQAAQAAKDACQRLQIDAS